MHIDFLCVISVNRLNYKYCLKLHRVLKTLNNKYFMRKISIQICETASKCTFIIFNDLNVDLEYLTTFNLLFVVNDS